MRFQNVNFWQYLCFIYSTIRLNFKTFTFLFPERWQILFLIVGLSLCFFSVQSKAQSIEAVHDSSKVGKEIATDSLRKPDKATKAPVIDAEPPNVKVNFTSKDSLIFLVKGEKRATLFGAAKVAHESGELSSGVIGVNFDTHIMNAEAAHIEDTLSHPVLKRQSDELRSRKILFNYQTERGKFEVARMSMQDGNLIGTEVKNKTEHVVFIHDGIYSTCLLDHPHYYIKAEKMKVVDEKEIFFTNARLYLLDIPYPLILPFGYVPADIEKNKSGLLSPTYAFQTQSDMGLGIQNLGWFQYFNDYFTGMISMNIYTSGTLNLNTDANYRKSDQLSGSVRLGYAKIQGLESSDPNFSKQTSNSVSISHNQTINPYSSFNANVSLRSAEYYRNTSYDIEERAEVSTNSKIGYSARDPNGLYNFSINASHSQNFSNNTTSLIGPNASLGFKTFTPFQQQGQQSGQPGPLESLTISFNSNLTSSYQYNPLAKDSATVNWFEALLSPSKYRAATGDKIPIKWGAVNRMSLSSRLLPSEVFNVNFNTNLNEYWHPYTVRYFYDETTNKVDYRVVNGFSAARDFSTGVSMNTTIYGISNVNLGQIKAFRHTIQPNISFNYQPNFQSDFWGYYREYERPTSDTTSTKVKYSIYDKGVSGQNFGQESRSISFSINNIFETKLVSRDTLGEKKERIIKLIDSWSLGSSYNFMAKEFKLSPLSSSISSSIINNINLRASANFDFYMEDSLGRRINKFLWNERKKPFRLTSFNFSTGTRFSQGRFAASNDPYYNPEFYDPLNQQEFWPDNPLFYSMSDIDYSVPWSVSLNFSYSWSKSGNRIRRSAILNANSIQVRPAPNWNISTTMGYDFIRKKLTPNQIQVSRNLHCWDMSFVWNPFSPKGQTYYLFRLTVNSAQFQSLFQKLPGLNNLERSSSKLPTRPYGF